MKCEIKGGYGAFQISDFKFLTWSNFLKKCENCMARVRSDVKKLPLQSVNFDTYYIINKTKLR